MYKHLPFWRYIHVDIGGYINKQNAVRKRWGRQDWNEIIVLVVLSIFLTRKCMHGWAPRKRQISWPFS